MTVEEAVADEVTPDTEAGAGSWSILGFDYQVDVSVWLALDVMVSARMATEMTLEHVSEEDVEADVEELEPATIAEAVPMHGYRLIVQAKRRTGNAWTEARYITLLKHGTGRKSALTRLNEDANARYHRAHPSSSSLQLSGWGGGAQWAGLPPCSLIHS